MPRLFQPAPVLALLLLALSMPLTACAPFLSRSTAPTPSPSPTLNNSQVEGVKEAQRPYYFPEKPITVLVGFDRGTVADTAARLISAQLEKVVGQPVVVANRTGDNGVEAWTQLKQAKGDGHTIGLIASPRFQIVAMTSPGGVSLTLTDFTPLGNQLQEPIAVFTRTWSPFETIESLTAAARAQPERISISVPARTAAGRVAAVDFARRAGLKLNIIQSVTTNDTLQTTLNGQVDAAFVRLPAVGQSIRAGQGRLLAVLDDSRAREYPEVPSLREKGIDVTGYFGLGYAAPKGTSQDVADYLAWALYLAASDPGYQERMREAGLSARFAGALPYWRILASEQERVRQLLPTLR